MSTRYLGARIPRNEDPRLLTGHGLFVDDVRLPGLAHAAVLRSPHAHARLRRVNVRRAREAPGVLAVYTASDLPKSLNGPLPKLIPHPALAHHKTQYALAPDIVRYAGEAIAFVVAQSRYAAEDALDLIEVDYEPRPPAASLEAAAGRGAPRVHDDMPSNVCARYTQRVGNVEAAFAAAPHRRTQRSTCSSPRTTTMRTIRSSASCSTAAPPPRSKRAGSPRPGMRAPAASTSGTARRPRFRFGTASRGCSGCYKSRCGWWRRTWAADSAPRS
jgi:CO/xanthine dehydrogenase Mo-binding subunit